MDKLHATESNPSPLEEMFLQLKTSTPEFLLEKPDIQESIKLNLAEISLPLIPPCHLGDHQTPYIDSALHRVGLARLTFHRQSAPL
jgi:hypothetical protein